MIIGKVISTVVSTSKHPVLRGQKLLLIENRYSEIKDSIVAVDTIGAGVGQLVLVSMYVDTSQTDKDKAHVDATVVGILDNEPII